MIREVMWSAWEEPGLGHLRLAVRDSGVVVADGLGLGVDEGHPFRIAYEVHCDANWRVRATRVGVLLLAALIGQGVPDHNAHQDKARCEA